MSWTKQCVPEKTIAARGATNADDICLRGTVSGKPTIMPISNNSAITSFPKPKKKKKKKKSASWQKFAKPQRIENKAYKDWIVSLPCLVTRRPGPSDPHHVPQRGHGAKSQKADDMRCIPLCHEKHVELHQVGRDTFSERYSLDYEPVIERLNKLWAHILSTSKK